MLGILAYLLTTISWDYNTIQLSVKLSRTNGILSKLRHFTRLSSFISVYYSWFYSHVTWLFGMVTNQYVEYKQN